MTRYIGAKTTTHRQEYWDPNKQGYYRHEVTIEQWLHATKGWRSPTRKKRVVPISRRTFYGVHTHCDFKRW